MQLFFAAVFAGAVDVAGGLAVVRLSVAPSDDEWSLVGSGERNPLVLYDFGELKSRFLNRLDIVAKAVQCAATPPTAPVRSSRDSQRPNATPQVRMGCCRYFCSAIFVAILSMTGMHMYKTVGLPDWWWESKMPDFVTHIDVADSAKMKHVFFRPM